MDKQIRDKLEAEFDPKYISRRKGATGNAQLSYLAAAQYIQRFNEATEGEWSYVVIEHFAQEKIGQKNAKGEQLYNLVVLVEVRAFGQVRQAFGGSVTPSGECQGDDWKSALTDALKKAIASFGVALSLYVKGELAREAEEESDEPPPRREETRRQPPAQQKPAEAPRLSGEQSAKIATLAGKLGWDEKAVDERAAKTYGAKVAALTPEQATNFIKRMELTLEKVKNGKGAA